MDTHSFDELARQGSHILKGVTKQIQRQDSSIKVRRVTTDNNTTSGMVKYSSDVILPPIGTPHLGNKEGLMQSSVVSQNMEFGGAGDYRVNLTTIVDSANDFTHGNSTLS